MPRERAQRIFILSPADCSGTRAKMVLTDAAGFDLARRLRRPEGAALGEVFSFLSGLYFRGKLAYARRFACPRQPPNPVVHGGVLVITANAGLLGADAPVTLDAVRAFAGVAIDPANDAYRLPLEESARAVRDAVGPGCDVVLLGSIATGKYVDVLQPVFGDRLLFPLEFVGRGDMSRGGLLLRCAAAGLELTYVPLAAAARRGRRPPKLPPLPRT